MVSPDDDQYSLDEAAQRRDAVIKHMLSKPPERALNRSLRL